jgi:hypothetical protein
LRVPRGGGRVLGVHGPGRFHGLHRRSAIARAGGDGRIAAEPTRRGPDRVRPIEVAADGHLQAGARPASRLARELNDAAFEGDRVVAGDETLLLVTLVTKDLLEVHPTEGMPVLPAPVRTPSFDVQSSFGVLR